MEILTLLSWITSFLLIWTHKCATERWHNNGLMSYYADDLQEFNRDEAEAACRDRGGRLALLRDTYIHQFVYRILPTQNGAGGMHYHIALNRGSLECGCSGGVSDSACVVCRRSWRWDDDTEMTTERWKVGRPLAENGRDCGVENSWKEYDAIFCDQKRGFICQYNCRPVGCHRADCSVSSTGNYRCVCEPGYIEQHCDIDFDECASQPCLHGATCINQIAAFQCNCVDGYTGVTCETDINECSSNPCLNEGTCRDRVNHYICDCKNGYNGYNCGTQIDECESNPCRNGGSCLDLIGAFNCTCAERYSGGTCEIVDGIPPTTAKPEPDNTALEVVLGVCVVITVIIWSSFGIMVLHHLRTIKKKPDEVRMSDIPEGEL